MSHSNPPPPSLSGYTVERLLAQGGMARVYLARQDALQRLVAIKVLDPRLADTESIEHFTVSIERFLREGMLIAALNQPNVVHIHDVGACADGLPYIVMEYLPGGTLRNRMQTALPPNEAFHICRQIAQGLAVAHAQGIIHRDIKPSNILFRADGTAVLTDFGIAKQLGNQEITRGGSTLGTPYYLSPEQALGQTVDGRADLYGLGVMLYEMLTGKKPFKGDSTMNTLLLHIQTPPPPLPPELEQYQPILNRLLAKQPEQRYSDANTLIMAIDRCTTLHSDSPDYFANAPWLAGLAGLIALAAIVLGATYLLRHWNKPTTGESTFPGEQQAFPNPGTATVSLTSALEPESRPQDPASMPPAQTAQPPLADAQTVSSTDPSPQEPPTTSPEQQPPAQEDATGSLWALLSQPPQDDPVNALFEAALTEHGLAHKTLLASTVHGPPTQDRATATPTTLDALLTAGHNALAEGRLLQPERDNALNYFNQALKLDARNPAARKGLQQLSDALFTKAEQALKLGKPREARSLVRDGLKIQPKHGKLRTLQTLLQTQGD